MGAIASGFVTICTAIVVTVATCAGIVWLFNPSSPPAVVATATISVLAGIVTACFLMCVIEEDWLKRHYGRN